MRLLILELPYNNIIVLPKETIKSCTNTTKEHRSINTIGIFIDIFNSNDDKLLSYTLHTYRITSSRVIQSSKI